MLVVYGMKEGMTIGNIPQCFFGLAFLCNSCRWRETNCKLCNFNELEIIESSLKIEESVYKFESTAAILLTWEFRKKI